MDPYGVRRVVSPRGALPQAAAVLDPRLPLGEDELSIDVEALNVDAASFRQLTEAAGGDPGRIGAAVEAIVRERGKLHNPVTGSGGVLVGRVREVGPRHPAAGSLAPGDRVVTLVSLSLTPLLLEGVRTVHPAAERVECRGTAVLFATGFCARLPGDLPEQVALSALDVCGAPALAARHARPGMRLLVIGAGKAGALVCAQARESLRGRGEVVAADRSAAALAALQRTGACDRVVQLDATDAVAAAAAAGGPYDLVVNCASVPGTEMASILPVRPGGTVIFFTTATSFTAAALGAEGVGRDALLVIGNGFVPGHAELTLDLLRRHPALRAFFEERHATR